MKITIIGGGPGGLYFALLAKKRWPRWEIAVHERNRADDTFGFGVVFSDETLGTFRDYDPPSYESIRRSFAYWGDVDVAPIGDRKSTRLNSSHSQISYAVFCLKKKKNKTRQTGTINKEQIMRPT